MECGTDISGRDSEHSEVGWLVGAGGWEVGGTAVSGVTTLCMKEIM